MSRRNFSQLAIILPPPFSVLPLPLLLPSLVRSEVDSPSEKSGCLGTPAQGDLPQTSVTALVNPVPGVNRALKEVTNRENPKGSLILVSLWQYRPRQMGLVGRSRPLRVQILPQQVSVQLLLIPADSLAVMAVPPRGCLPRGLETHCPNSDFCLTNCDGSCWLLTISGMNDSSEMEGTPVIWILAWEGLYLLLAAYIRTR